MGEKKNKNQVTSRGWTVLP